MPLTHQHRKQITAWFCIFFYALMLFKWWNGLLLYQLQPFIFNTRFDLVTWLLMQAGIHQWLIIHPAARIIFDVVFYSMPLLLWLAFQRSFKAASVVAVVMLLVNWIYIQCYTLYPANSIESFTGWLLFPILFITVNIQNFFFILHGLRYFFLFVFASAGIWKFVQGGVFNIEQMSGVLLYQHKEFLVSSPGYWFTGLIYWLINHPPASYILYLAGTLLELLFLIGYFTRNIDRLLIAAFVIFVIMDFLLMRIYYWELSPFILTLIYSKYKKPVSAL